MAVVFVVCIKSLYVQHVTYNAREPYSPRHPPAHNTPHPHIPPPTPSQNVIQNIHQDHHWRYSSRSGVWIPLLGVPWAAPRQQHCYQDHTVALMVCLHVRGCIIYTTRLTLLPFGMRGGMGGGGECVWVCVWECVCRCLFYQSIRIMRMCHAPH